MAQPHPGVRLLSEPNTTSYRELDAITSIIDSASDRTARSDELAAHITDRRSRTHLARQPVNLLQPLDLLPRSRILEVGSGTGTFARALGEAGHTVVAVEDQLDHANVAAARCEDLDTVEVVCGDITELEAGGFDLVLCVGTLAHTTTATGGNLTPTDFLSELTGKLRPGGTLAVAVENRYGIQYLSGAPEEHHNIRGLGLEGYPNPATNGDTIYSRRQLAALFAAAGLPHLHWLYPFPDYRLPHVIIDQSAYRQANVTDLVDQLAGYPVATQHHASAAGDVRARHRGLLDAGVGEEVANSFLVLASDTALHTNPAPPVAWLGGGERLRHWLRPRRIVPSGNRWQVVADGQDEDEEVCDGWLSQLRRHRQPHIDGRDLYQQLAEVLHQGDKPAAARVLHRWAETIFRHECDLPAGTHPFSPLDGEQRLECHLLDTNLDNFLDDGDQIHFFDDEWRVDGPISAPLALLRGLRYAAAALVATGAHHPFGSQLTVGELTAALWRLAGRGKLDPALLWRLRPAEVELQHKVSGQDMSVLRRRQEQLDQRMNAEERPPCDVSRVLARSLEDMRRERDAARRDAVAASECAAESARREQQLHTETEQRLEQLTGQRTADRAALEELIHATRAVTGSRRWQWGNRLGNVADRFRHVERQVPPAARADAALQGAAEALARRPAPATLTVRTSKAPPPHR